MKKLTTLISFLLLFSCAKREMATAELKINFQALATSASGGLFVIAYNKTNNSHFMKKVSVTDTTLSFDTNAYLV